MYSVDHEAEPFIVRLNENRAKLNPFLKEQWVTARMRTEGLPVADILEVGDDPLPYMILRKSPGEPATFQPDRKRIIRDLGGYAARINCIRTHGFGAAFDRSPEPSSHQRSWNEFLSGEFQLEKRLRALRRFGMVARPQLDKIGALLESACGKGRTAALNHGDLRPKNVLVDEKGRISAILDWENCSSNLAPEWELSLALHDLSIDEKEEFIAGYGLNPKAVSAIAPTMKALNLMNYVQEIDRLAREEDRAQLERHRLRLSGALDLYCL